MSSRAKDELNKRRKEIVVGGLGGLGWRRETDFMFNNIFSLSRHQHKMFH